MKRSFKSRWVSINAAYYRERMVQDENKVKGEQAGGGGDAGAFAGGGVERPADDAVAGAVDEGGGAVGVPGAGANGDTGTEEKAKG